MKYSSNNNETIAMSLNIYFILVMRQNLKDMNRRAVNFTIMTKYGSIYTMRYTMTKIV